MLALCLAAQSAHSQEPPGWIGISLDIQMTERLGRSPRVVITAVSLGSPADEAGIRVGDHLLAINDLTRADEFRNIGERLRLSPGDRVRVLLEQDGRRRELTLVASERPNVVAMRRRFDLDFEPDAMVETIMRQMDSLRVQLSDGRDGRIRTVVVGPASGRSVSVLAPSDLPWAQAPFEFLVFGGEERDSLTQKMEDLNDAILDLRELERARVTELSRAPRGAEDPQGADVELRQVRATLQELSRESAALRASMVEVARRNAGVQYVPNALAGEAPAPVAEPEPASEFRPLMPYLLGRNRVAGAEVIDLRPELAEYFRVEGGVLVVDVPGGTPASIAGIRPGDVVTRIAGVLVRSVDDLRFGVSQAGDTLPISLIRQGQSIQALLRR